MIFRRISFRLALQFTGFVLAFLLLTGALFLFADFRNAKMQSRDRLSRAMHLVIQSMPGDLLDLPRTLPPFMRDRVRIVDALGQTQFSGTFFDDVPLTIEQGFQDMMMENEQYSILTARVLRDGVVVGYIQVGDVERFQRGDLPDRAFLYLVVSLAISAITFFVGLFFARTSLKPAEEMVERLEQFSQDASHELRTPLAALMSSLDLALKTQKYREGIESAKDDVKQITSLIERLLEITRLDAFTLQTEPLNLSHFIEETVERLRPMAAEKGVKIETTLSSKAKVKGDPALLRQVLQNLLTNAIKFRRSTDAQVKVTLTASHLKVSDNGIGIPKDALPHIFERFYQADDSRAHGGCGLGLALVKRIVELHGWTISVASEEENGTTFTVKIS